MEEVSNSQQSIGFTFKCSRLHNHQRDMPGIDICFCINYFMYISVFDQCMYHECIDLYFEYGPLLSSVVGLNELLLIYLL